MISFRPSGLENSVNKFLFFGKSRHKAHDFLKEKLGYAGKFLAQDAVSDAYGVLAMIPLAAACGGHGGGNDGNATNPALPNTPAAPTVPADIPYTPILNFDGIDNYLLLITHVENNINDPLAYLGDQSIEDLQDVSMTNSAFRDNYNLDPEFRDAVRALYTPLIQSLAFAREGKILNQDQTNAEIDSFMSNLTDNIPTCLDNVNLGEGDPKVFLLKTNVDGSDKYALVYSLIDNNSNPYLLVTIGGLTTQTGATVSNDLMANLYDLIKANAEAGFE